MTEKMMGTDQKTELEAAAFRALIHHLMVKRPDVQNIDLMNLGGFCRNCLSRWYQEAAAERGVAMTKDEARALQASLAPVLAGWAARGRFAFPALELWHYRGGPWERVKSCAFRGRARL